MRDVRIMLSRLETFSGYDVRLISVSPSYVKIDQRVSLDPASTIKALIVAAIGGFANPVGILIGGILFGIFESLSNYMDSGFGDLYPLLAALVIIAIKPSGLFSERGTDVR